MKNFRNLLIAVSALMFINVAQAQTPASADATAKPTYSDPIVQKRSDDAAAKQEYKARKKAAKKKMKAEKKAAKAEMKVEKKDAKSELKAEKSESTAVRNNAMATDAAAPKASSKTSDPQSK